MSGMETTMAGLWATGISPDDHPVRHVRAALDARGILRADQLSTAENGTRVLVGGVVTHRQRPATASGVTFLNLDDETGMINIICSGSVWNRYRRIARESGALIIRGWLERSQGVTNLVADKLERLPGRSDHFAGLPVTASHGAAETGSVGRDGRLRCGDMHRSRVSTLLIDVPREDAADANDFWTAALGVRSQSPPGEPQYLTLHDAVPGMVTAIQVLDEGEARYHLDIETDDVDAETARLTGLGAVEVSSWQGCRTLRVPGGQLLCVIPVHSDPQEFAANATPWP